MDEAKKMEIARLAGIVHDKRQAVQNLGLLNVYGVPPDEARQRSIQYAQAQAELYHAQALLDAAMQSGTPILDHLRRLRASGQGPAA